MALDVQPIPEKPPSALDRAVALRKPIRDTFTTVLGPNGSSEIDDSTPNLLLTISHFGRKYTLVVVIKPSPETILACNHAEAVWQVVNEAMTRAAEQNQRTAAEKRQKDAAAFNADAKAAGAKMMEIVRQKWADKEKLEVAATKTENDTETEVQSLPVIPTVSETHSVTIFGPAILGCTEMPVDEDLKRICEQSKPVELCKMTVTRCLAPSALDSDKLKFQTRFQIDSPQYLAKGPANQSAGLATASFLKDIINKIGTNSGKLSLISADTFTEMQNFLSHQLRGQVYTPPEPSQPGDTATTGGDGAAGQPPSRTAEEIADHRTRIDAANARAKLIGMPQKKYEY